MSKNPTLNELINTAIANQLLVIIAMQEYLINLDDIDDGFPDNLDNPCQNLRILIELRGWIPTNE
jgi:hypothetical protein